MFKKIRANTFKELTMNVFMLMSEFDPATFNFATGIDGSKIIAATTGGVTMADTPEYTDFGEDIDNCPKNCMELKHKEDGDVNISGNLVTLNTAVAKMVIGAADVDGSKVTPRTSLKISDFANVLWGITDYGEGGILAIKMKRVLNTSGFSISTTDRNKSQIAFTFTCHKTIEDETDPPYELFILTPDGPAAYGIELNTHSASVTENEAVTLTAEVAPSGTSVTWSSSDDTVASVTNGVVTGESEGSAIITASITVDGVTYTDTCTIVVNAAETGV